MNNLFKEVIVEDENEETVIHPNRNHSNPAGQHYSRLSNAPNSNQISSSIGKRKKAALA